MLLDKNIIFRRKRLPQNHVFTANYPLEEYFFSMEINQHKFEINTVHVKSNKPKGWVFYLHGTKHHIQYHLAKIDTFLAQQYDVVMIDYPQYGKSNGILTEDTIYKVVEQTYFQSLQKIPLSGEMVLVGRSLGTALASNLATKITVKNTILISPYYSMPDLFQHKTKIFSFKKLNFKFENHSHLQQALGNIYILHGTADKLIPIMLAQKLQPLLKSAEYFFAIDNANHFNIHKKEKYRQIIADILS